MFQRYQPHAGALCHLLTISCLCGCIATTFFEGVLACLNGICFSAAGPVIFHACSTVHKGSTFRSYLLETSSNQNYVYCQGLHALTADTKGLAMQTVWIVDVITWTLLVPMLTSDPDQQLVAFWKSQFYNFTSYNMVRTSPLMQMQPQTSSQPPSCTICEPCGCCTAALRI